MMNPAVTNDFTDHATKNKMEKRGLTGEGFERLPVKRVLRIV